MSEMSDTRVAVLLWARPLRATSDHRVTSRSDRRAVCGAAITEDALWSSRPGRPCSLCSEVVRKEALAGYIEGLLDQMERKFSAPAEFSILRLKPKDFDGAMPFVPEFYELIPDHDGILYAGFSPKEVRWPIDVRMIANDDENPGALVIAKYRGLDPKAVRGRVTPSLPYPLLCATWWLNTGDALSTIFGYRGPRQWANISPFHARGMIGQPTRSQETLDYWSTRVQIALGQSMLKRTQWRIYLSNGGLGIEFPTDPVGVREVFRLRDIPDGKERRAALRHWVTEHWRLNVQDPSEEVKVRQHFRGKVDFAWSGLNCRITPSEEDFTLEYQAIIEREQSRVEGTDRRPLVTLDV